MHDVWVSAICDHLVHEWDLAQGNRPAYGVDSDILDVAWEFTRSNMTPERRRPGRPYAEAAAIVESQQ
jgi:hypothetical protein